MKLLARRRRGLAKELADYVAVDVDLIRNDVQRAVSEIRAELRRSRLTAERAPALTVPPEVVEYFRDGARWTHDMTGIAAKPGSYLSLSIERARRDLVLTVINHDGAPIWRVQMTGWPPPQ